MTTATFPLGRLVATPNVMAKILHQEIRAALQRHASGDWGEVDQHDWNENELSLKEGFRLFSVYRSERGIKFWIITEADRRMTTVMLPEDY